MQCLDRESESSENRRPWLKAPISSSSLLGLCAEWQQKHFCCTSSLESYLLMWNRSKCTPRIPRLKSRRIVQLWGGAATWWTGSSPSFLGILPWLTIAICYLFFIIFILYIIILYYFIFLFNTFIENAWDSTKLFANIVPLVRICISDDFFKIKGSFSARACSCRKWTLGSCKNVWLFL